MPESPRTRESLILRLPTAGDASAWQEFVAIYEPLVYRFARRRGLQDADAKELVQNVFIAVARAISNWQPDPNRGKFRAWLFRIARNQVINMAAKKHLDRGSGRTSAMLALQQVTDDQASKEIQLDYRRELFRTAALLVRKNVHESTWQAFWMTWVEGHTTEEAASQLSISTSAVYIARSRVLHQLRVLVRQWESNNE
jgi:RNA polymerase sigma-70 factor (ECF subfamily)